MKVFLILLPAMYLFASLAIWWRCILQYELQIIVIRLMMCLQVYREDDHQVLRIAYLCSYLGVLTFGLPWIFQFLFCGKGKKISGVWKFISLIITTQHNFFFLITNFIDDDSHIFYLVGVFLLLCSAFSKISFQFLNKFFQHWKKA